MLKEKKSLRNTASISPNDTIRDEKLWKMTKLWKTKSHKKSKDVNEIKLCKESRT